MKHVESDVPSTPSDPFGLDALNNNIFRDIVICTSMFVIAISVAVIWCMSWTS
jgi:hypothetical protein